MKNVTLFRRFAIGSLILGLVAPMTYHIVLNVSRAEHVANLTQQICKAIEPRIQIGAHREALEYLQGVVASQGLEVAPEVVFADHGQLVTPERRNPKNQIREACSFQGISGVSVEIFYAEPPFNNPIYAYLYVFSSLTILGLLYLARSGVLRLQKQVAYRLGSHIQELLGMESKRREQKSLTDWLFDLELPLLKTLRSRIDTLESSLKSYSARIAEHERKMVLTDVAAQVAHDIVTPLATLQKIVSAQSGAPGIDQALLESEIERVRALSEKLLRQYRGERASARPIEIDIVETARIAIKEAKHFAEGKGKITVSFLNHSNRPLFALGQKSDLASAISNLLLNSIESIVKDDLTVRLEIQDRADMVELSVVDNGRGIDSENLSRIFDRGVTLGKENGTGLGLSQVKDAMREMNGSIDIQSTVGVGTTITLRIPVLPPESNYRFLTEPNTRLMLVDDDKVIHEAWAMKLQALPRRPKFKEVLFLSNTAELDRHLETNNFNRDLIFIDYDLGESQTGLDWIIESKTSDRAVLLTGQASNQKIIDIAKQNHVRIIDKMDLDKVEFVETGHNQADLVLIDDSKANHIAWTIEAKKLGRNLACFLDLNTFTRGASGLAKTTPIFIDFSLDSSGYTGRDVARTLFQEGFTQLYISTGYPPERVGQIPEVIRVLGKEFPDLKSLGERSCP